MYNRISFYLATGIVVSMAVPANVEHLFQQKAMYTYCARTVIAIVQLQYFICQQARVGNKVVWVGAVCVVEKCGASFYHGREIYFLFVSPRGPLEPTQFLHLSGTRYSTQRVKVSQELTTCT